MWATRGPLDLDDFQRACVTSVTLQSHDPSHARRWSSDHPHGKGQRSGGSTKRPKGGLGTSKGHPVASPVCVSRGFVWTSARGSQGPSGRPATRGTIPGHIFYDHSTEGVNALACALAFGQWPLRTNH
eukprot:CAMPEP_0181201916 /NCGR_PEP_ID=MMETSP1096-20121128/18556_1 /TAXON_ID=156174 ORGANISM="Chrysochromulina ericina, Strain CCMP281" /NCGR_SAMPLE_ID=MMETSP1096 /ASSEMBLY_ACC=CAM_ASM_000453 /LENGTH=127 /DNA_ID=CAMNT_0023292379 /DNA_START=11 /DNA_END=394 /DNA_ORIENTATION=-